MKILSIAPSYFPATKFGGPIFSTKLLNKYLSNNNIVEVVTSSAGTKFRNNIKYIDNIKVNYLPSYGPDNFTYSPGLILYLLKNIKKFDIVQINAIWNFHFIIGAIFCIVYKKPFETYPKGSLDKNAIYSKNKNLKLIYLRLLRKLINKSSLIVYSSRIEKNNSIKLINNKFCEIIANPVEKPKKTKSTVRQKTILYLGRIAKNKGIFELINNFNKTTNNYKLIIAGSVEDSKYFEMISNTARSNNQIIILGNQNSINKTKLIKSCFCLILPSKVFENFGNVVAESLVLNTPVIVSSRAGVSEYVYKYRAGVIINPSKYDLNTCLINIKNNYKLLQENGRLLVQTEFYPDNIAKATNRTYIKVMNKFYINK